MSILFSIPAFDITTYEERKTGFEAGLSTFLS